MNTFGEIMFSLQTFSDEIPCFLAQGRNCQGFLEAGVKPQARVALSFKQEQVTAAAVHCSGPTSAGSRLAWGVPMATGGTGGSWTQHMLLSAVISPPWGCVQGKAMVSGYCGCRTAVPGTCWQTTAFR